MSSRRRSAANRRNAQHSTGPKTPEGKAASAQNATTHGLSSSFTVLPHEDHDAYAQLLDTLAREHAPANEHEKFLVTRMAESRWRLDRTHRFEAVAYDQLLDEYDESNPDHLIVRKLTNRTSNIIDLLQRYATAAERSYYKAHRELTQGRKGEKRNEAKVAADPLAWLKERLDQNPDPPDHDPFWAPPRQPQTGNQRNEANGAEQDGRPQGGESQMKPNRREAANDTQPSAWVMSLVALAYSDVYGWNFSLSIAGPVSLPGSAPSPRRAPGASSERCGWDPQSGASLARAGSGLIRKVKSPAIRSGR